MDFLTSETCQNLARSFAGESQARTRYQLAAAVARREDLEVVARIFETAAANELAHAQEFLELLCKWNRGGLENLTISAGYPYVLGTVAENLKAAQAGEWEEHSDVYPAFAAAAEREGFADAARLWRGIAVAEGVHYEVFRQCGAQLEAGQLFSKASPVVWRCANCGYTYTAKTAALTCPVCGKPVGWMLGDVESQPPALASDHKNSR